MSNMNRQERSLLKKLGLSDLMPELLHQALTHVSAVREGNLPNYCSNERLEFLGDAVLELAVSNTLYQHWPGADEGQLTSRRAQLVCQENLVRIALELQLGEMLSLSRGERKTGGASKPALLADAFEALIGAIFLTYGYAAADEVIQHLMCSESELAKLEKPSPHQWKSLLQETVQREGARKIRYEVQSHGSDHKPIFEAVLRVDGVIMGKGSGGSKQEAEQAAAKAAMDELNASQSG